MSSDRDVARIVRSWLGEGGAGMPDQILRIVADRLPKTTQRRPIGLTWRITMNNPRYALASAVLITVLAVGGYVLAGLSRPSSVATRTPAASPTTAWIGGPELEPATTYTFQLPVPTTFQVPAGWKYLETSRGQSVIVNDPMTEAVAWIAPTGVYRDPCQWIGSGESAVGSNVNSLVDALASLPGVRATKPATTTIGGRAATAVTLTSSVDSAGCDEGKIRYWSAAGDAYDLAGTTNVYAIQWDAGLPEPGAPQQVVVVAWSASLDASLSPDLAVILHSIRFP